MLGRPVALNTIDLSQDGLSHSAGLTLTERHLTDVGSTHTKIIGDAGEETAVQQWPPKKLPCGVNLTCHFLTGHQVQLYKAVLDRCQGKSVQTGAKLATPAWAVKIRYLRDEVLKESQGQFARRFAVAPAAVSNWERGINAPSPSNFIQMGALAGDPDCWFFWQEAGLSREALEPALVSLSQRLLKSHSSGITKADDPSAGVLVIEESRRPAKRRNQFEIPLLKPGRPLSRPARLEKDSIQEMITISSKLVPTPDETVCITVQTDTMKPLVQPGYIAAIECHARKTEQAFDQIVAASGPGGRIGLFWLRDLHGEPTLVPNSADSDGAVILLSRDRNWRLVGRVLWWIGMPK